MEIKDRESSAEIIAMGLSPTSRVLKVEEKSRLDYDHIPQLIVTLFEQYISFYVY